MPAEREVRISTAGKLRAVASPYVTSGTTDSTGTVTFAIPAGTFATVTAAVPTVVRNTTAPASFAWAFIRTQTTSQVVVQVAESKTTNTLLLSSAEGAEAAGPGVTVTLVVYGT